MTNRRSRCLLRQVAVLVLTLLGTTGCGSIPVEQREQARQAVISATDSALAAFKADEPGVGAEIDASPGYIVATGTDALYGVFGRGQSIGILYDQGQNTRTFLNIDKYGIGPGVGSAEVELLTVIKDADALEEFKTGRWVPTANLISIAGDASGVALWTNDEISVRIRSQSGAALGANLQMTRVDVNTELTDTGISNVGIPNIGGPRGDRQGEDAPRVWTRRLPFLGQRVVDAGYDLPLPLGLGLTYTDIRQDQELTELFVSFVGGDLERFEFVTFENADTDTESYQLKFDAWLLPFLNVFGLYGRVDGTARLDVFLDGNLILDELGTNCSRPVARPPLCNALEDRTIEFPVRANIDVETYGLGAILAGGWNGWFATLPMSVNYAQPRRNVTDGFSFTVTPRLGRLFDLGNLGSLAVFAGGNYLKSDLTIDGTFTFPGENLTIDYRVDQKNSDEWNVVTGFNWDITKRFSWSAEYNGYIGSREAFITSLNGRF